jgi:hypothetical protein
MPIFSTIIPFYSAKNMVESMRTQKTNYYQKPESRKSMNLDELKKELGYEELEKRMEGYVNSDGHLVCQKNLTGKPIEYRNALADTTEKTPEYYNNLIDERTYEVPEEIHPELQELADSLSYSTSELTSDYNCMEHGTDNYATQLRKETEASQAAQTDQTDHGQEVEHHGDIEDALTWFKSFAPVSSSLTEPEVPLDYSTWFENIVTSVMFGNILWGILSFYDWIAESGDGSKVGLSFAVFMFLAWFYSRIDNKYLAYPESNQLVHVTHPFFQVKEEKLGGLQNIAGAGYKRNTETRDEKEISKYCPTFLMPNGYTVNLGSYYEEGEELDRLKTRVQCLCQHFQFPITLLKEGFTVVPKKEARTGKWVLDIAKSEGFTIGFVFYIGFFIGGMAAMDYLWSILRDII